MLRRWKIGTKLTLLLALALVAVGAVAVVGVVVGGRDAAVPVLAAAAVALVVVAGVGRALVRGIVSPLRSLATTADEVASIRLPHALDALPSSPDAVATRLPPIRVDAADEIGDLATSFDEMQRAAMMLVSEQARTRRDVEEAFVDLGRRNQGLLNRTLAVITELEDGARDPETLEALFRLDHLATRMHRNAESLLVLAGVEPSRTWPDPLGIDDLARAALSQIEGYERVELGALDGAVVVGRAVDGVAHVLAELLENATAFSPPDTVVTVSGRAGDGGYVLSILDRGLGMDADALTAANRALGEPQGLPWGSTRTLGLSVVGRLARRFGLEVRLRAGVERGLVADVALPSVLLVPGAAEPPRSGGPGRTPDDRTAKVSDGLPASGAGPAIVLASPPPPVPPPVPPPPAGIPVAAASPDEAAAPAALGVEAQLAPFLPGLPARAAGAQLPDLGPAPVAPAPEARPARVPGDVARSLARLQGGVRRGRDERAAASGTGSALTRRRPGEQLPDTGPAAHDPARAGAPGRAPHEVRRGLGGLQAGVERARHEVAATATAGAGLRRRVPGAHLPDLGPHPRPTPSRSRDPEAVRRSLAGLQRGVGRGRTEAEAPDPPAVGADPMDETVEHPVEAP